MATLTPHCLFLLVTLWDKLHLEHDLVFSSVCPWTNRKFVPYLSVPKLGIFPFLLHGTFGTNRKFCPILSRCPVPYLSVPKLGLFPKWDRTNYKVSHFVPFGTDRTYRVFVPFCPKWDMGQIGSFVPFCPVIFHCLHSINKFSFNDKPTMFFCFSSNSFICTAKIITHIR